MFLWSFIIHYSEYSTEKIAFYARYQYKFYWHLIYHLNMKDETIEFTVPTFPNNFAEDLKFFISSHRLNLRNIHYINITSENKNITRFVLSITYGTLEVHNHSWFHTTVFYSPHPSNIKGRQYDVEMIDMYRTRTVTRIDFIQFIFINMSTSNIFDAPVWYLHITKDEYTYNYIMNTSYFTFLPTDFLQKSYRLGFNSLRGQGRNSKIAVTHLWVMVHMVKPEDVSPYAIWRVWLEVTDLCNTVSHISLEVLFGKYHSSSIYRWNHLNKNDDIYMTVDKAVNILFESACFLTYISRDFYTVWFLHHFIYDDRTATYAAGQTPQGSFFTFHNQK